MRDALKLPVTLALLKGRANYVCHHHLERAAADGRLALARGRAAPSADRRVLRARRETGDRGTLADVPENATIWPLVTSTRDNCLGADCAFHSECFVLKARKAALEADVVVVNHHLFFADVMLRDEGLAELLPACNTLILDEAHQLPDTATLFFGEQLSAGQLAELARDAEVAARTGAREVTALPDAASGIGPAIRKLRLALGETPGKIAQRAAADQAGFADALDEMTAALDRLAAELALFAERSEEIASCARRAAEAAAQLARWRGGAHDAGERRPGPCGERRSGAGSAMDTLGRRHAGGLAAAGVAAVGRRRVPKRVAESGRAWIFTSATLAVGRRLFALPARTGPGRCGHRVLGSRRSTTHRRRCSTCRPTCPQPNSREHTEAVVAAALPVLDASGGRAFLLFTTLRALNIARELLAEAFARDGRDWPLLVQGEGSRSELLARFRELGNAILLGSASFWEGVDVPGAALSVVIIDKLPFAPPDDPLLAARLERLRGRRRQSVPRLPAAAGRHQPEAGRGPAHPHRDRSRRADDLRPAAGRQAVRQTNLAELAADASDTGTEGRRGVLAIGVRYVTNAAPSGHGDRRCRVCCPSDLILLPFPTRASTRASRQPRR